MVVGGGLAAPLGVGALAALAAWGLVLGVVAFASRARMPAAGPATMELRAEPPALVNLLVNGWHLEREAVPATLIDLAARRFVELEQVSPERVVCRLREGAGGALRPYEAQVLAHLHSLAIGGVVPADALTVGPQDTARRWWSRFRVAVEADALTRGLARPRWSKPAIVVLSVFAAPVAGLGAAAFAAMPGDSSNSDGNVIGPIALAVVAWVALSALPRKLRALRETEVGQAACAHWLGVQRFLDDDDALDAHSPAAVQVWDQYLAYGAALGASRSAVAGLPFGAESPTRAWSSFGGRWRLVRVRYPRVWPPSWGRHPAWAALVGLAQAALLGVVALGVVGVLAGDADAPGRLARDLQAMRGQGRAALALAIVGAAVAVALAWLVLAVRALAQLVWGLGDLGARREVRGVALRVRPGAKVGSTRATWVAVDDGSSGEVRAWKVVGPTTAQGVWVQARVSRRLGHVRGLTATAAPAQRMPARSERPAAWAPPRPQARPAPPPQRG